MTLIDFLLLDWKILYNLILAQKPLVTNNWWRKQKFQVPKVAFSLSECTFKKKLMFLRKTRFYWKRGCVKSGNDPL